MKIKTEQVAAIILALIATAFLGAIGGLYGEPEIQPLAAVSASKSRVYFNGKRIKSFECKYNSRGWMICTSTRY